MKLTGKILIGVSEIIPKSYFILLFLLLLSGCYTVGTVEIEVIKPAKITIPAGVKTLLVLNNSITYHSNFKNDIKTALFRLDTTTTQMLAENICGMINQSPRFDTCVLAKDIYFRKKTDVFSKIKWENIHNLCREYNADAVLSLEGFGVTDTIMRVAGVDDAGYYTSFKTLALRVNSLWRIYIDKTEQVIERRVQRDTLYFSELSSYKAYYNAITDDKALVYIANEIAGNVSAIISDRLAPYWLSVYRDFFSGSNKQLQRAADYAYHDNWHQATLIWKALTKSDDNKLAGVACFNMALASEVAGKTDLALIWLDKAEEKYDNYLIDNYRMILQKRIEEAKKLDKQFGVE